MSEHLYTEDELISLLRRAKELEFSLDEGSILEQLTIAELERLVTVKM